MMSHPWSYWKSKLSKSSLEAFEDSECGDNVPWTEDEVFDYIVRYNGGLASGYETRCLVQEVYGVKLGGRL